jgi:hypothetical protein
MEDPKLDYFAYCLGDDCWNPGAYRLFDTVEDRAPLTHWTGTTLDWHEFCPDCADKYKISLEHGYWKCA